MTKEKAKHTALALVSLVLLVGPDVEKLAAGDFGDWKTAVRFFVGWLLAFCTSGKATALVGTLWPEEKPAERKPDSGVAGLVMLLAVAAAAAVIAYGAGSAGIGR